MTCRTRTDEYRTNRVLKREWEKAHFKVKRLKNNWAGFGYKGLSREGFSPLQSLPCCYYKVGTIVVDRCSLDRNRYEGCGEGLHFCPTFFDAKSWCHNQYCNVVFVGFWLDEAVIPFADYRKTSLKKKARAERLYVAKDHNLCEKMMRKDLAY